jgi:hypothetical protein
MTITRCSLFNHLSADMRADHKRKIAAFEKRLHAGQQVAARELRTGL